MPRPSCLAIHLGRKRGLSKTVHKLDCPVRKGGEHLLSPLGRCLPGIVLPNPSIRSVPASATNERRVNTLELHDVKPLRLDIASAVIHKIHGPKGRHIHGIRVYPEICRGLLRAAVAAAPCGIKLARKLPPVKKRHLAAAVIELVASHGKGAGVAAMTVDEAEMPGAVMVELTTDARSDLVEKVVPKGQCSGIIDEVVGRPKSKRRPIENFRPTLTHKVHYPLGRHPISAQGIMPSMILRAAEPKNNQVAVCEVGLNRRPRRSLEKQLFSPPFRGRAKAIPMNRPQRAIHTGADRDKHK